MALLVLLLLVVAFAAFAFEAIRSRGGLIAIGLALWVLAEIILAWPK